MASHPELDDTAAWRALAPLSRAYLPWSSAAMRPSGLVAVLNDVWLRRRRRVVELGSGVSTVFLARLLADLHGCDQLSLVSVEHDESWVVRITDQLRHEGLSGVARIVHAPLRAHALSWDDAGWYDEDQLRAAIEGAYGHERVDLLVVDGPPASVPGTEHALRGM